MIAACFTSDGIRRQTAPQKEHGNYPRLFQCPTGQIKNHTKLPCQTRQIDFENRPKITPLQSCARRAKSKVCGFSATLGNATFCPCCTHQHQSLVAGRPRMSWQLSVARVVFAAQLVWLPLQGANWFCRDVSPHLWCAFP